MLSSICCTLLRLSRSRSMDPVRQNSFEIACSGGHGLSIDDPRKMHALRSLPGGNAFSALGLGCIPYACFERIEPGKDMGEDGRDTVEGQS
ncbi:MAG: hypothetical protein GYA39_05920 [Methanothrix sp.]|nr:hypothetical protein [Methanothrix sp.]